MSTPTTVADALVVEINDPTRTWAGQQTAQRSWNPQWSIDPQSGLPQLSTAPVLTVIPDSVPTKARITRGLQNESHVIFLLLQAKIKTADGVAIANADIDPLVALLEAVTDWFFADGHFVAAASFRCKCIEARIETYCHRADLEDLRCYTGCASLTFEVVR